ncbi:RNA-binding protein [bacterium]|nr:RNA-binding protein [Chloroflexi bacterium CFX6]RIL11286.1 MAG: RNA-binding protein [bacterium]
MNSKLYVGNLSYQVTEQELRTMFGEAGAIESVAIPVDRTTNQPRGFAFVTMASDADAQNAIRMCDGKTLGQRQIRVNISQPKESSGGGYYNRR